MLMCKTLINHLYLSLRSRELSRARVIKRLYLRQELVECAILVIGSTMSGPTIGMLCKSCITGPSSSSSPERSPFKIP